MSAQPSALDDDDDDDDDARPRASVANARGTEHAFGRRSLDAARSRREPRRIHSFISAAPPP